MKWTVGSFFKTARGGQPNGSLPVLSVREAYDRWAPAYRARMNAVQTLEEDALLSMLPDLAGKDVLDVGCGTGRVSKIAIGRGATSTTGIDTSGTMLDVARAQSGERSRWIRGDVCALPFEPSSFDVVICALTLGHVERLDVALREMNRVLKGAGNVLISGFHPFATLRGAVRTFRDPADDRTYAIAQHVHLFEEYFRCFREYGWGLEAFEEPRYAGDPVVFVLRARKKLPGENET